VTFGALINRFLKEAMPPFLKQHQSTGPGSAPRSQTPSRLPPLAAPPDQPSPHSASTADVPFHNERSHSILGRGAGSAKSAISRLMRSVRARGSAVASSLLRSRVEQLSFSAGSPRTSIEAVICLQFSSH
jgi:hypothetical protein